MAPADTPAVDEGSPSRARLFSVLAIVFVACAGLVLAGIFLGSGASDPHGASQVAQVAPHDVPAPDAPGVVLAAATDAAGGWNLHIVTRNFTWAPQHAGGAHVAGEGHAHVWVGDTKVGRAYGEWFYLPESLVPVGKQTVRVGLTGNDHGDYRADGVPVVGTVTVVSNAEAAPDGHHHQH